MAPWRRRPHPTLPPTARAGSSSRGRVSVARLSEPIADAIQRADGRMTLSDFAAESGVEIAALPDAVTSLSEIGAVRRSIGS